MLFPFFTALTFTLTVQQECIKLEVVYHESKLWQHSLWVPALVLALAVFFTPMLLNLKKFQFHLKMYMKKQQYIYVNQSQFPCAHFKNSWQNENYKALMLHFNLHPSWKKNKKQKHLCNWIAPWIWGFFLEYHFLFERMTDKWWLLRLECLTYIFLKMNKVNLPLQGK